MWKLVFWVFRNQQTPKRLCSVRDCLECHQVIVLATHQGGHRLKPLQIISVRLPSRGCLYCKAWKLLYNHSTIPEDQRIFKPRYISTDRRISIQNVLYTLYNVTASTNYWFKQPWKPVKHTSAVSFESHSPITLLIINKYQISFAYNYYYWTI